MLCHLMSIVVVLYRGLLKIIGHVMSGALERIAENYWSRHEWCSIEDCRKLLVTS